MSSRLTASANHNVRLWSAPLRPNQSMAKMRTPCSVREAALVKIGATRSRRLRPPVLSKIDFRLVWVTEPTARNRAESAEGELLVVLVSP